MLPKGVFIGSSEALCEIPKLKARIKKESSQRRDTLWLGPVWEPETHYATGHA